MKSETLSAGLLSITALLSIVGVDQIIKNEPQNTADHSLLSPLGQNIVNQVDQSVQDAVTNLFPKTPQADTPRVQIEVPVNGTYIFMKKEKKDVTEEELNDYVYGAAARFAADKLKKHEVDQEQATALIATLANATKFLDSDAFGTNIQLLIQEGEIDEKRSTNLVFFVDHKNKRIVFNRESHFLSPFPTANQNATENVFKNTQQPRLELYLGDAFSDFSSSQESKSH